MKDRRGPVGRVGELAAGLAAAAKRRQQDREPRLLVYDDAGHGRVVGPHDSAFAPLLETGSELIELGLSE